MLFPPKIRRVLFIVAAGLVLFAALYHFIRIFYHSDETPVWRHILFIGINLFCVYGFLKRPFYFIYFMAILSLQQYYSHGTYLINLWHTKHEIHWISVGVLLFLPVALICLIEDRRYNQSKT